MASKIPKGHVPAYAWPSLYGEITDKVPRKTAAVQAEFRRQLLGMSHVEYCDMVRKIQKYINKGPRKS